MKKKEKRSWATVAEECRKKYNETDHSVTGFSPEYLLNGKPTDLLPPELTKTRRNLEEDRHLALLRSRKSHEYNNTLYDKNRICHKFKEGDMVYVANKNKLNRKKLDEIRVGPFKIEKRISDSIFQIDTGNRRSEISLYHVSKLIPVD